MVLHHLHELSPKIIRQATPEFGPGQNGLQLAERPPAGADITKAHRGV
jgi:hypothetical protein